MKPRERGIRQVLGTCLSALIVTLSVAVPVLERADLARGTAFESRHDPVACSPGHDHTLCTQIGAGHALPSRRGLRPGASLFVYAPMGQTLASAFVSSLAEGSPPRGPPLR